MKLAVTVDDRTYSIELPWWLLAAALAAALMWQPATAWAAHQFSDVPDSNIFHDDIDWMADTGVTAGCGSDRFCPDDFVTREQMSAFMHRLETKGVVMRANEVTAELAALQQQIDTLQTLLAGVSRQGNTLRFTGMNLQLRDGSGGTVGTVNGLGNLIIGYNENVLDYPRTGSHNLVVGPDHGYTSYGGLVAGRNNRISGSHASVIGGAANTASGLHASVTGGVGGTASGADASITGGSGNLASGNASTVSGGQSRSVSGTWDWRAGSLFEAD